jgi:hypothetical protein
MENPDENVQTPINIEKKTKKKKQKIYKIRHAALSTRGSVSANRKDSIFKKLPVLIGEKSESLFRCLPKISTFVGMTVFIILLTFCVNISAQPYQDFAIFGINKLPAHAHFIPFQNEKTALTFDKSKSEYFKSLNGEWAIDFTAKNGSNKEFGINIPSNTEMNNNFSDNSFLHYTNIKAPFNGSNPPFITSDKNHTAMYSRQFETPKNWKNQPVFIHFEGVQSAFYLFVNGKEVGYSEGSMTPTEFDISKYLKAGKNNLSVKVIRWSDGSYLKSQDYWRMSGIYRDVWLFTLPEKHIWDFEVITDLDENYLDAELIVNVQTVSVFPLIETQFEINCRLFRDFLKPYRFQNRHGLFRQKNNRFLIIQNADC